ncbi:hypothetical protein FGG78_19355 [Thioclava sp. BHET1]|nr:hypothetical protein FGG78_19355 [Thioclava sp. BHET1]
MDSFKDFPVTPTAPFQDAAAVTPDDDGDLPVLPRALYLGTGGDLAVVTAGGQSVTFSALPDGSLLPLRARRIAATGTTAGAILALW